MDLKVSKVTRNILLVTDQTIKGIADYKDGAYQVKIEIMGDVANIYFDTWTKQTRSEKLTLIEAWLLSTHANGFTWADWTGWMSGNHRKMKFPAFTLT